MAADGRTLPWRILHRAVKPYALGLSFSTFAVSYASTSRVRHSGAM